MFNMKKYFFTLVLVACAIELSIAGEEIQTTTESVKQTQLTASNSTVLADNNTKKLNLIDSDNYNGLPSLLTESDVSQENPLSSRTSRTFLHHHLYHHHKRPSPLVGRLLQRLISIPGVIEMIPPKVLAEIAEHPKVTEALIKAAKEEGAKADGDDQSFFENLSKDTSSDSASTSGFNDDKQFSDGNTDFSQGGQDFSAGSQDSEGFGSENYGNSQGFDKPSQVQKNSYAESSFTQNQRADTMLVMPPFYQGKNNHRNSWDSSNQQQGSALNLQRDPVRDSIFNLKSVDYLQNSTKSLVGNLQKSAYLTQFLSIISVALHKIPITSPAPQLTSDQVSYLPTSDTLTTSASIDDSEISRPIDGPLPPIASDVVFIDSNNSHGSVLPTENPGLPLDLTGIIDPRVQVEIEDQSVTTTTTEQTDEGMRDETEVIADAINAYQIDNTQAAEKNLEEIALATINITGDIENIDEEEDTETDA